MELNVGMYVRTKDGEIAKILEIDNDTFSEPALRLDTFPLGMYQGFQKYIKASYNIIDLIEVGDFITLGEDCYPLQIMNLWEFCDDISIELSNGSKFENLHDNNDFKIFSIVTKEQFSQCIYKVGKINE